jgi:hypothetical protein
MSAAHALQPCMAVIDTCCHYVCALCHTESFWSACNERAASAVLFRDDNKAQAESGGMFSHLVASCQVGTYTLTAVYCIGYEQGC